ncbi:MAG TPA: 5-formyltetrahydrofolate cyclo-ligase [Candidatus Saccharimonadales bacterium]|nr:5-formyltetrahydrofolate cyclo-ligase [Candidatus Saccharimonadales bacterium]
MDKDKLRRKYTKIWQSIGPEAAATNSLAICRQVFRQVDWSKIKTVCSYNPIAKLNEVDIKPLLDAVTYKYPDIKIMLLKQSKNQPIPRTEFDLILVPCLAFDRGNYRLGWGGGFYDRFLAGQPSALKVGVSSQSAFVKEGLPREPHDIPLDMVITEK